jgi:hypothetical protein
MKKWKLVSSNARGGLFALAVSLLASLACAAGPTVPAALQSNQNGSSSTESVLKKDDLLYADRVAWRSRLNWPQDCESTFDYPDKSFAGVTFYELSRGSRGQNLVQVTCTLGSYQGTYVFMLLDESVSPSKTTLLHFVAYEDSGEQGPGRLQNSDTTELTGTPEFDSTTKQLRVLDKFRGLGDCGLQATYSFSEGQPELTLLQGKLNCDGKVTSSPRQWKKLPLP